MERVAIMMTTTDRMKKCLHRRRPPPSSARIGSRSRIRSQAASAVRGAFQLPFLPPPPSPPSSRGRGGGGREEGRTDGGTDERTGQVNPHCEQFLGGEGAAAAERRSIYTAVEWLAWMLHWTQAMGGTISLTVRIVLGQLPTMFCHLGSNC